MIKPTPLVLAAALLLGTTMPSVAGSVTAAEIRSHDWGNCGTVNAARDAKVAKFLTAGSFTQARKNRARDFHQQYPGSGTFYAAHVLASHDGDIAAVLADNSVDQARFSRGMGCIEGGL